MVEFLSALILAIIIITPMSIAANLSRSPGMAFILGMLAEFFYLLMVK